MNQSGLKRRSPQFHLLTEGSAMVHGCHLGLQHRALCLVLSHDHIPAPCWGGMELWTIPSLIYIQGKWEHSAHGVWSVHQDFSSHLGLRPSHISGPAWASSSVNSRERLVVYISEVNKCVYLGWFGGLCLFIIINFFIVWSLPPCSQNFWLIQAEGLN